MSATDSHSDPIEVEEPGWRQRLGGPHAVTLTAWLWLTPWSLWSTLAYGPGAFTHPTVWTWVGVGLGGHLAAGGVLLGAWATVLRPSRERARPWTAVVVLVLASEARSAAVGVLSVSAQLMREPYFLYRLTTGAAVHAVWLALVTILVDAHRRDRSTRAALCEHLRRLDELRADAQALLSDRRRRVVDEIRATVDVAVDELRRQEFAPRSVARRLRALVDEVVRPLSRRLEASPPQLDEQPTSTPVTPTSQRSIGDWLDDITTIAPFPRTVPAVVTMASTLPLMVFFGEPIVAPFVVLALGVIVYGGHELADRATRPWRANASRAHRTATVLALWLLIAVTVTAPVSLMTTATTVIAHAPVAVITSVLTITIVTAAAVAVHHHRRATVRRLRTAIADLEAERDHLLQLAEHDQRHLARLVHGQIQARILGGALLLEQVARDGTELDVRLVLDDLAASCARALEWQPTPDVRTQLGDLATVWGVAATIEITLDDETADRLRADRAASEAVVTVVGEALSNAVHHGGASHVRVRVTWEPMTSEALVVVDDDGRLTTPGTPGLGSQLFDSHSRWWSLTPGDDGTRLAARISLRAIPATTDAAAGHR